VPAGLGDVAVLTELGRYLMAPCGALVTRVIGTKSTYRDYLGVDACSADLMRPMLYGAYHHVSVVGRAGEPADHLYDIVGGLCENSDRLAERRALPATSEGDLLFIHDVGAHGHAMGYQYNGKLRHAEVLLRSDGTSQLIRRAETPEDYFATLDCLEVGRLLTKRKHD
jgi:diaminopimelate decarboxylase